MFVRCKKRRKDGKTVGAPVLERGGERAWVHGGRVVQRQVLYLGEINDSQRAAWCRSIEVLEGKSGWRQMALFPEGREVPVLDCEVVQVQVHNVEVHDPRQWGRVLAGPVCVGPPGAGPVLGTTIAGEPTRHAMAGHPQGAGLLPSDRPGQ